MREILFRGKRVDNGEWVEGFYSNWIYDDKRQGLQRIHYISANEKSGAVYGNTVGQYTGLTDKTGKKIFEGDIVKVERDFYKAENKKEREIFIGVVCYDEKFTSFGLQGKKYMNLTMHRFNGDYQIVIGNINDNPELIKAVQND